ncbi:MAG: HAD family acid phosphatase [Cyanobacteria bacterium J06554_1]
MSLKTFLAGSAAATCLTGAIAYAQNSEADRNSLMYAVAWKQTAAEYRALYYQGFNVARMHVEQALEEHQEGDKPLAIVTDLDDTLIHPLEYWGTLINKNIDFFDDPIWDAWIPTNGVIASPGAKEFLEFCKENNVEIFYITSRNQGEGTFDYALGHIRYLGFPLDDESNLTVLTDTSNKETRQNEIMENYDVAVFLGDSLNDFRRKYYVKGDIEGRIAVMEEDHSLYGNKYVLFPNPTDGHWIAGIFGESEPPATDENRAILRSAASMRSWDEE